MSEPTPDRGTGTGTGTGTGAVGGLVFAVLSVAALVTMPPPPDADAKVTTLRHFFTAHGGSVRAASTISALGALALLPFFATLRRRIPGVAADTLFAAGVLTSTVGVVGAVLQAGLANSHARLSDSGLTTYFAAERMVFYVAPAVSVAAVGLAAAVAYRGALAGWLTVLSGLLGVVALVGGIATTVSDAKAAGAIGLVGFILTIVWAAASAIVVLRERRT